MKTEYFSPIVEKFEFDTEDVIFTSGDPDDKANPDYGCSGEVSVNDNDF